MPRDNSTTARSKCTRPTSAQHALLAEMTLGSKRLWALSQGPTGYAMRYILRGSQVGDYARVSEAAVSGLVARGLIEQAYIAPFPDLEWNYRITPAGEAVVRAAAIEAQRHRPTPAPFPDEWPW